MNRFVLLLFATSVALGAVTLHLVRELRAERDNSEALHARIAELERSTSIASPFSSPDQIATLTPEPARPESAIETEDENDAPVAAVRTGPVAIKPDPTPQGMPSREERIRMMRENMQRQRALMKDPEYRDAMRTQHKDMLARMHPDLAGELGMTAYEADQLLSLLAEQQLRAAENHTAPFFDGTPDPGAIEEMQRQAQQRQQANEMEVAALLGTEKSQAWKDYQSTMGVRHQVRELQSRFAAKGAPLQEHQVKPLLRALTDAQQRMMQEWNRNPPQGQLATAAFGPGGQIPGRGVRLESQVNLQEQHLERQIEQDRQVRESAASILTAEQLQLFEEEQNTKVRLQRAQLRMMRAQAEAEARGEISGGSPNGMFIPGSAIPLASPR